MSEHLISVLSGWAFVAMLIIILSRFKRQKT